MPATEIARPAETELAEPSGPGRRSLLLFVLVAAVLLGATAAGAAILLGGSDTIDVTGRVLDSRSGKPLAGVSVETDEVAAVTRADGRFTLLDVAPDTVVGFASCAHLGRQVAAETVEDEVRLFPRPVAGKVTSGLTGRPIAATVREGPRSARTAKNGRYSLYGSCPGSTVKVSAPGFLAQTAEIGPNRIANAVLAAPKTIRETFANVRNWLAGAGASTGSTADGWNAFVADGAYHVRVTRPNYESGANAADFDPATKAISDNVSYVRPTDIRYAVDTTKVTGADDSTAAGVTCNSKTGLSYEFLVGSDGYYRLDRRPRQGAKTVELSAWKLSSAIKRGTGTNRLHVVCRGNPVRVQLSVNGQKLIDVTDGGRAPGFQSIYLYAASYATAPIEIAFDNLVFTRE